MAFRDVPVVVLLLGAQILAAAVDAVGNERLEGWDVSGEPGNREDGIRPCVFFLKQRLQ